METSDGAEHESWRKILGRPVGADQRSQAGVHEAIDERAVERVGRSAKLGKHSADAGGHRIRLDVLDDRRFASDEM